MGLDNSLSTYNSTFLRGLRFDRDLIIESSECGPLGQLFVYASREIHYPRLIELLNRLNKADPDKVFDMLLYIRSPRGGRGSRLVGRYCFQWFMLHFAEYLQENISAIPQHGRWDDLFWLFPGAMKLDDLDYVCRNFVCNLSKEQLNKAIATQKAIVQYVCDCMLQDFRTYSQGGIPSLLVKWLPTERSALDLKFGICATLLTTLNLSAHDYRVVYISPMRETRKVTERLMCNGEWDNIDFESVPSGCASKNRIAFRRRLGYKKDSSAFTEPDILVEKCIVQLLKHGAKRSKLLSDHSVEASWLRVSGIVRKHSSARAKVVIDTDGTMYCPTGRTRLISRAIAAALLIADASNSQDDELGILSFTKNKGFVKLHYDPSATLLEMTNKIRLTFTSKPTVADLIELSKEDDSAESIIYLAAGDTLPGENSLKEPLTKRIIVWNICSNVFSYKEEKNIVKIKGFREDILRYLICFGNFDPRVSAISSWR